MAAGDVAGGGAVGPSRLDLFVEKPRRRALPVRRPLRAPTARSLRGRLGAEASAFHTSAPRRCPVDQHLDAALDRVGDLGQASIVAGRHRLAAAVFDTTTPLHQLDASSRPPRS